MTTEGVSWKDKAAAKLAAVRGKIPQEWLLSPEYLNGDESSAHGVLDIPRQCGILTAAELDITERYSAVTLARAVQNGQIKAADVATAFCKRAAIAKQLTNCLTETMFDDALKRGRFLDDYLAEHKKPVGPLHGVPVSVKESFHYPGVQSSLGFVSFLDKDPDRDSAALVEIILELGAILYCKTNVPQTLMTAESQNNVFGRVLNPHKLKLGAGGSSGGEGALVAFRGSILGVGTDIGGSIRIPSLCNGTYGFKPSSWRIPYGGQTAPVKIGSPGFPPVAGPLANSFEDLQFFMRHVIDAKPWNRDFMALSIPWRSSVADEQNPSIRIGYLAQDPRYPVHPPVARALTEAVAKLKSAGFAVDPLDNFPSIETSIQLATDYYSLDNTKTFKKFIDDSGEPMIPSLTKHYWTVNKKEQFSLEEVFDLNVAAGGYAAAWNSVWVDNQLDVILCPSAQTTAVVHDDFGVPIYTAVWNLLEYPAIVLPVGKVSSIKLGGAFDLERESQYDKSLSIADLACVLPGRQCG